MKPMNKETFSYTYSADRQEEIKKIREKYLPKEVTKLDQLRALDAGVTRRGTAVSLAHGILYALVLGMSCCMVWAGNLFVPGVVIGCIGLAGVAALPKKKDGGHPKKDSRPQKNDSHSRSGQQNKSRGTQKPQEKHADNRRTDGKNHAYHH